MNQTQLKYCKERANRIFNVKVKEINRKFTKPGKSLNNKERVGLIKSGKVKLKAKIIYSRYGSMGLEDFFDFSKFEWEEETEEKALFVKQRLKDNYDLLLDEIILGSEAKAKELLQKFIQY